MGEPRGVIDAAAKAAFKELAAQAIKNEGLEPLDCSTQQDLTRVISFDEIDLRALVRAIIKEVDTLG